MTTLDEARATLETDYAAGEYSGGGYRYVEATPEALRTVLDALARIDPSPADDKREALADVIEQAISERFDIGSIADAILASDVWHQN